MVDKPMARKRKAGLTQWPTCIVGDHLEEVGLVERGILADFLAQLAEFGAQLARHHASDNPLPLPAQVPPLHVFCVADFASTGRQADVAGCLLVFGYFCSLTATHSCVSSDTDVIQTSKHFFDRMSQTKCVVQARCIKESVRASTVLLKIR